jgi:hypothetical protein
VKYAGNADFSNVLAYFGGSRPGRQPKQSVVKKLTKFVD